MWFVIIVAVVIAIIATIYAKRFEELCRPSTDVFQLKRRLERSDPPSVLFVTSHPDDECMFFAPTLHYLVNGNINVHLLCLSTGNFHGFGETRRVELLNSCLKLGIAPTQVHQLNQFSDDINKFWDEREVVTVIDRFVNLTKAEAVFTFDGRGVSGHPNHISVFNGVKNLKGLVPVFTLDSVNTIRKYIQAIDIIPSMFNKYLIVSGGKGYRATYNAMLCHKSQLVWYRRLYLIFSRYILINTWTRLK